MPEFVVKVLQRLLSSGFEAFLVGGCVRDGLLGRRVHDYDVATNATPEQVVSLFESVLCTGLKHGTVTVLTTDSPVEITTYRLDGTYTDGRHPDVVTFANSVTDDLARRDFTINAMAVDVRGTLVDPFAGTADLSTSTIRAVGLPSARFREDSLRILRGLRLSAELEFTIDEATLTAMYEASHRLKSVSSERIGQELAKIANSNWWFVAGLLASGNWLEDSRPTLVHMKQGIQHLLHRPDVSPSLALAWYKTIDSLPVSDPNVRRVGCLATILAVVPNFTESIITSLTEMAWAKKQLKVARTAAQLMQAEIEEWSEARWRQVLFEYESTTVELACRIYDWMQLGSTTASRYQNRTCLNLFKQYCATQPLFKLSDLHINGSDILQLGAKGPLIGSVQRQLAQDVLAGSVRNSRQALLNRTRELIEGDGR
ncbi:CCA tRNA nucleotidyltransferase [Alicyclobacillus sp. SO9]|uniref:CCA tRNA nucleotidyltransferase n=1 Tax=Alicyclobacillus sp. SO9 TaxID=2665646 RepID=UPI0018E7A06D|nr:hypothetical protein [Alicyclobacillus sp. SO9]